MDIHNEYLKGWLQANEKNKNVGKFIKELDKSVADENKNYYEYLDENIGDDASFTIEELEKIKKGKLFMEYHKKDGKLHFYEYL